MEPLLRLRRPALARALVLAGLILCFLVAAAPAAARTGGPARGLAYGLTVDNRLISFDPTNPGALRSERPVSGLKAGEALLGIDFRPATDRLYGLGSTGQVYVIDLTTAFGRPIGAPLALSGSQFGVDFNPAADRLRVVSDAGQNLRINPDTGVALVDKNLAYGPNDPNAGKAPTVIAAAYTNSDNDPATGTMLYDLDGPLGVLALQDPPNDGVLSTKAQAMANITGLAAFDLASGTQGLIAVQQGGQSASRLYAVDVAALSAVELGTVGAGEALRGLAIYLDAARYDEAYALNDLGELVGFKKNNPRQISSRVAISGLAAGDSLVGIDFRPSTRRLYGLGASGQLYVIGQSSGVAAAIGGPLALSGGQFGFDFNPAADRLRIVSDSGQNLRINPDSGAVAGVDGTLTYGPNDPNAGKAPTIAAAAYTNSDNDPATGTVLYDIDVALGVLAVQDPPNDGVLSTRGQAMANISGLAAFDLEAGTWGLVALQQGGRAASTIYTIDVGQLTAAPVGRLGRGEVVRGLAIAPR